MPKSAETNKDCVNAQLLQAKEESRTRLAASVSARDWRSTYLTLKTKLSIAASPARSQHDRLHSIR